MSEEKELRRLKVGFRWWRFIITPENPEGKLVSPTMKTIEWEKPELEGETIYACPTVRALKMWQGAPGPDLVILEPVRNGHKVISVECSVPGMIVVDTEEPPMVQWWMFSAKKVRIATFGDTDGAATRPLAEVIARGRSEVIAGSERFTVRVGRDEESDDEVKRGSAFLQTLKLVNLQDFGGGKLQALAKRWSVDLVPMRYLQAQADGHQAVSRVPGFLKAHSQLREILDGKTAVELAQGLPEIVMSGAPKDVTRWAMEQLDHWESHGTVVHDALSGSLSHILSLEDVDPEVQDWSWKKAIRTIPAQLRTLLTADSKEIRDRTWEEISKDLDNREISQIRRTCLAEALVDAIPRLIGFGEHARVDRIIEFAQTADTPEIGEAFIEILPDLVAAKATPEVKVVRGIIGNAIADDWSAGPKLVSLVRKLEGLDDAKTLRWAWWQVRKHARSIDAEIATDLLQELYLWEGLKGKRGALNRACALIQECAESDPDGAMRRDIRDRLLMNFRFMPKRQALSLAQLVGFEF